MAGLGAGCLWPCRLPVAQSGACAAMVASTGAVARPQSWRSPPSAPQNVIPVSTLEHLADERFVACCIRTSREPMRTSMRTSPTQLQTFRLQTSLATDLPKASQRLPKGLQGPPQGFQGPPKGFRAPPKGMRRLRAAAESCCQATADVARPQGLWPSHEGCVFS